MAKGGKSKTNVAARLDSKALAALATCRFCGQKPEVVKVLTPSGKAQMFRKCCANAKAA